MCPTDPEFRLFSLLSGDLTYSPLLLTQIPLKAARRLGWAARNVFVTIKDAQKIAHHPMHGMDAVRGLALPMVIRRGDYYQSGQRGTDLQVEVVLHEAGNPRRAYFLVLARNREDTGIFIRTFFFNAELSRSKMKGATRILSQSTTNYFK
ncbi:MAG: hypothetical protein CFE34_11475 [Rhodobacteraceae bacterium PARR1]|nr:MAG: hypothetical protein CFE34_11475 [Rhodobacteraceae bacterium PARR1]